MNTIEIGKIFCCRYNRENGTNMTPKEIFREVIANAVYDSPLPMVCLGNNMLTKRAGSFSTFWRRGGSQKYATMSEAYEEFSKINPFEKKLDDFCKNVERTPKAGYTDMCNVYMGCAEVNKNEVSTTIWCSNKNLSFDIDERYCSFIGAMFQVQVGQFTVCLYDENIIWSLFKSFKEYREWLDDNEAHEEAARKLFTWNGNWIYENAYGEFCAEEHIKVNGDTQKFHIDTLTAAKFLMTINKLEYKPNYFSIHSSGNTNITCPTIYMDRHFGDTMSMVYRELGASIRDSKEFDTILGTALIYNIIESGAVTNRLINSEVLDSMQRGAEKISYSKKIAILKNIMTKQDQEIADKLADWVTNCVEHAGKNSMKTQIESIFSPKTPDKFLESVLDLYNMTENGFADDSIHEVEEYVTLDDNRESFRSIILLASNAYYMKNNKKQK